MTVPDDGLAMFVAEVARHGGTANRRPGLEALLDVTAPTGRTSVVKLKTKQRGDWQAQKTDGRVRDRNPLDAWVFVDVNEPISNARIVDAEWMRADIQDLVDEWLAADPSRDANTQRHHKIEESRVAEWVGRWDLLGLSGGKSATTPAGKTSSQRAVTEENLGAWVFICNPDVWKLQEFIEDDNNWIDSWSVVDNYRSAMIREGQRAVLWVSESKGRTIARGVHGLGWTTGTRYEVVGTVDGDDGYWANKQKQTDVGWLAPTDITLMDTPLDADTLRNHPGLADLEILRTPYTSNPSWLSAEQVAALEELVGEWPEPDPFAGPPITVSAGGARRGDPETNRLVEHAAIDEVIAHYESQDYTVENVDSQNLGWDLTCTAPDGTIRRVEVKGVGGQQPSILLTRNELRSAREDQNWELAVVTRALSAPLLQIFPADEVIDAAVGYVYQVDLHDR
ncbi:DUF3883 domain-containing protein [Gordonia phosphorivorans]|uniref:DUF3883 domain-containing protein n=1 Tax=Gordonia phosphorivorans TaxID=1056982 RepID=A0ABV6H8H3_9ACTN